MKFKELSKSKQIVLLITIIILSLLIIGGIVFIIILNAMFTKPIKISEGTYDYQGNTIELLTDLKIDNIEVSFLRSDIKDIDESDKTNVIKDYFDESIYTIDFKMRINGESDYRTITLKYNGSVAVNVYKFSSVNNSEFPIELMFFHLTDAGYNHDAQSIRLDFSYLDKNNNPYSREIDLLLVSK